MPGKVTERMKTLAILMPTYNAGLYLQESIESILSQTFRDFNFYIIDDSSTDNSEEIVRSFNDSRIIYWKNPTNLGIAKSLNRGLKELLPQYAYIARMDADDWAFSSRLELQLKALERDKDLVLCGTQGYWLPKLDIDPKLVWKYPTDYMALRMNLLFSASFGHSSVMLRSKFFQDENLAYNEKYKTCEDWELWCRVVKIGKATNLPEFLMKYRTHPNSNHRVNSNRKVLLLEKCAVIQKCWFNFNLYIDATEVHNFYFNNGNLGKPEFKETLKRFLSLFNHLSAKEFDRMKAKDREYFKYRFSRNILTYWKNSGISRLKLSVWILIIQKVNFTNKVDLIKNLIR